MTDNPPRGASVEDAQSRIEEQVASAGTSFYWAMRTLPPERRAAIFAVYAFCRAVDDIADEPGELEQKRLELDRWRRKVDELFEGRVDGDIATALMPAVGRYGLERDAFLAVIDGMEMDADGPIVGPGHDELLTYCYRVASAVGLLCVRIFGETGPAGREVADQLGLALQLTNILRDLGEDAQMGRLYLPAELLEKYGISEDSPDAVLAHPAVDAVCRDLAGVARTAFARAAKAISEADAGTMRPAIMMMTVYRRILSRLERRGWSPEAIARSEGLFGGLAWKLEKLLIALRFSMFSRQ